MVASFAEPPVSGAGPIISMTVILPAIGLTNADISLIVALDWLL